MKTKKEIKPTLSQEEYQKLLTHPKWQRKRLEIMQRDDFRCTKCKDEETTLHVHHIEYHNGLKPWEYEDKDLATLCEHCHFEIEYLKKVKQNVVFSDVSIFKFAPLDTQPRRFIAVQFKGECHFSIYGEKEQLHSSIPFARKDMIESGIKLLTNCLEWKKINPKKINNQPNF